MLKRLLGTINPKVKASAGVGAVTVAVLALLRALGITFEGVTDETAVLIATTVAGYLKSS